MSKIWRIYAWVTIILFIFIILLISFWGLWPYTPIKFNKLPLPVSTKTVKRGEVLRYETDFCKYSRTIPSVQKIFVDSITYNIVSPFVSSKQVGCADLDIGLEVPKALPVGNYHLQIIYNYKVNPIREITVVVESETFDVVQ